MKRKGLFDLYEPTREDGREISDISMVYRKPAVPPAPVLIQMTKDLVTDVKLLRQQ